MAKDATAPVAVAPADGIGERDYQALLATLSASALGRAFLDEFARRQRVAETDTLLAAMARLEAMVAAQQAPAAPAEAEPPPPLPLHLSVVVPAPEPQSEVAVEAAQDAPAPEPQAEPPAAAEPAPLATPEPVAQQAEAEPAPVSIPEVTWFAEPRTAEPRVMPPAAESQPGESEAEAPPPRDPYEQLMILTEEERIALFS